MSIMMGLRVAVDPNRFEQAVNGDRDRILEISQAAKDAGAIHHAFYANDDGGEILVVDEWPSKEAFLEFFEGNTRVPELMSEAGVTERPTPVFWRQLDTPDKF
jgi:hypothetical protein